MVDIKKKQAEHLRIVLSELDLTYDEFAATISAKRKGTLKLSKTTVYNWARGRTEMAKAKAEEIHRCFPQYSVEYLRGYSDYPNEKAKRDAEHNQKLTDFLSELDCIERLLSLDGYSIEYLSSPEPSEIIALEDGSDLIIRDEYARISNGEKSATLTIEQWRAFRQEIRAYLNMRIGSMLERGAW